MSIEEAKWQKDWMATFTGRSVFPLDVRPEDIDVRDIAHSLATQARYNGHSRYPYWVAQHSVLISQALERDGYDAETCMVGLLHDSSETWTSDITKPMKNSLRTALAPLGKGDWLKDVERRIEHEVAKLFGLPYPWPHIVEEYDTRIVLDEKRALFKPTAMPWNIPAEPLNVVIEEWTWQRAENEFLDRYSMLALAMCVGPSCRAR